MSSCTRLMSVFWISHCYTIFWMKIFVCSYMNNACNYWKRKNSQYTVTNYFFLHWTKIDWVRIETSSQDVIQLLVLISKWINWIFFSSLHSKKSKAQNMETFFFKPEAKHSISIEFSITFAIISMGWTNLCFSFKTQLSAHLQFHSSHNLWQITLFIVGVFPFLAF